MSVYSFTAAILVLCAVAVSFTDGKCAPMQWEAVIAGQSVQMIQGKMGKYGFFGTYSADYKLKKDALYELVLEDNKVVANYTFLRSADVSFFVDNYQRKCTRLPAAEVKQLCSDSDELKYLNSWTLGNQMTDTYEYNGEGRVGTITFLRDSFTIVFQAFKQVVGGVPQEIAMQHGNVTTTIKNPNIFDPPSFC